MDEELTRDTLRQDGLRCPPTKTSPAQEHDHGIGLGWHEPELEDVLAATVVALQDSLSEGPILVQADLIAACAHEMVDNVTEQRNKRKKQQH